MRITRKPRGSRVAVAAAVLIGASLALVGCTNSSPPAPVSHSARPSTNPSPSSATPEPEATGPASDAGPRVHAQGTASPQGAGRYRYTVAADDTPTGIATRFGLCVVDIENSNNDADPLGTGINAGQVLTIMRTAGPHHGDDCGVGYS